MRTCVSVIARAVGWAKRPVRRSSKSEGGSVPTFKSTLAKVGTARERLCPPYKTCAPRTLIDRHFQQPLRLAQSAFDLAPVGFGDHQPAPHPRPATRHGTPLPARPALYSIAATAGGRASF